MTSEERSVDVRGAARFPPAPTSLDVGQRRYSGDVSGVEKAHLAVSQSGDMTQLWITEQAYNIVGRRTEAIAGGGQRQRRSTEILVTTSADD